MEPADLPPLPCEQEWENAQNRNDRETIQHSEHAGSFWKAIRVLFGILATLVILANIGISFCAIHISLTLNQERLTNPKQMIGNEGLLVALGMLSGICPGGGPITTGWAALSQKNRPWKLAWVLVGLGTLAGLQAGFILAFGPVPPNNGCFSGMAAFGQKIIGALFMVVSTICFIALGACLIGCRPIRPGNFTDMATNAPKPTLDQ